MESKIFDLNGKKLIDILTNLEDKIDLAELEDGVYLLKLNKSVSKIIISRK